MTTAMAPSRDESSPWLLPGDRSDQARARLFCFHHAGGGASMFFPWSKASPPDIHVVSVQMPGREHRIREDCITTLSPVVQTIARVLEPWLDLPYAMFGHSMGASIAFETARELRRGGQPMPVHLGVSGRIAPHLRSRFSPVHTLDDSELIDRIRSAGGMPAHVVSEPELLELVLSVIRADYCIVDDYRYAPEPPLACSISAHYGQDDILANASEVEAWREHTEGSFSSHGHTGDHFFVNEHRASIQGIVERALQAAMPPVPRA